MAETAQVEPQRPAQLHAPQPVFEKMPLQSQQPMQFFPFAPGQQQQPLLHPASNGDDERPFSRPWHIAKIVLGSASIISSTIIWAISIVMLARYTNECDYGDGFYPYFEAGFSMSIVRIKTSPL
jgi:hypothetical protein